MRKYRGKRLKRELPEQEALQKELKRELYRRRFRRLLRSTVNALIVVAAIAALVATLVLPVLQIEGTSMDPTLTSGDIVLLTKSTRMDRGDICGFAWNNKLLVKRVIDAYYPEATYSPKGSLNH